MPPPAADDEDRHRTGCSPASSTIATNRRRNMRLYTPNSPPSYIMEISFEKSCIRRRCTCLLHKEEIPSLLLPQHHQRTHHPFHQPSGSYIDNTTRNPNRKSVTVQFYGRPFSTTLVPYHHFLFAHRRIAKKNTSRMRGPVANLNIRRYMCVHRRRGRVPKPRPTASKHPSQDEMALPSMLPW
jgi:hypothetical protein